jgi:hypothetical protein
MVVKYIVAYRPVHGQRPRNKQQPLLGSDPRATKEVLLEAVFSMWSAPRLHHAIYRVSEVVGW